MTPIRVLIVDESPLLRRDVRRAIARTGVAGIHDFGSGADVFQVLPAVQPAIAIIGHRLEDMAGLELSRMIRAEPIYQGMPLILLSPAGDLHDLMEAVNNGVDDYVLLPFEAANLASKVAAALERVPERRRQGPRASGTGHAGKGYAHLPHLGKSGA